MSGAVDSPCGRVDVAIVIVTYNSAPVIEALLDSIPGALSGLSADVVVVDNSSTDSTVEVLRSRSDCRVFVEPNDGYSAGFNRGVQRARDAEAVLLLNPDVRLDPGCIATLVRVLDDDPAVGIAAPLIRSDDGMRQPTLRREPTLPRALGLSATGLAVFCEHVQEPEAYEQPGPADWALGAVLAISRACLDAVGEWDESFFLYSEETDFCLRASSRGFATRFEPSASAMHIGGQSGQSNAIHSMQIINRVRLYRRRHNVVAAWLYFGCTIVTELSWVARHHPQSWFAIKALVRPRLRPPQLGCSDAVLPR